MAVVLICSTRPLDRDLQGTVLFRSHLEREMVRSTTEVQSRLAKGMVALLCIHRDTPGIETLIRTLRRKKSA